MEEKKLTLAEQIAKDISIRDSDLDGCMTEQASLYAYYSSLYAKASIDASRAKNRAEMEKARAYKRHRNKLIAKGIKFTESMLEAEILLDDAYQESLELANAYRYQEMIAKEALEAFKQRRDMLVQKGKSALEELKGELFLKGKVGDYDSRAAERQEKMRAALDKTGTR